MPDEGDHNGLSRSGGATADFEYYNAFESVGMGYVAAALRQSGAGVELLDGTVDPLGVDGLVEQALTLNPRMVGFSILWDGYDDVREMCRKLREGGYGGHITVGQHFATFNYERVLNDVPEMDSVVRFEGEETAVELLERVRAGASLEGMAGLATRVDGKVVAGCPRRLVPDLDALPFPARDVMARQPERFPQVTLSGSRGCPWRCRFCTITTFYKTPPGKIFRHRSPENIADEMEELGRRFGKRNFVFTDDQFLGSGNNGRRFARGFAEELIRRKLDVGFYLGTRADSVREDVFALLVEAGLTDVFLGVESGYQPTLDYYRKDIAVETQRDAILTLQRLGVNLHLGFIMFHERSTLEEVKANLDFLRTVRKMSWEGPGMFFGDLSIFAGSSFMEDEAPVELSPEQSYKRQWDIADPNARHYRGVMRQVLSPLATPFQNLSLQRNRGSVPESVLKPVEDDMREFTFHVAQDVLDRVERAPLTGAEVRALAEQVEGRATRMQIALEVAQMLCNRDAPPTRAGGLL